MQAIVMDESKRGLSRGYDEGWTEGYRAKYDAHFHRLRERRHNPYLEGTPEYEGYEDGYAEAAIFTWK